MRLNILFSQIGFILSLSALAQKEIFQPNELDQKYSPGKNSLFSGENSSSGSSGSEPVEIRNSIKFNPTLPIGRNMLGFFYERAISSTITVMGGAGWCFNTDKMMAWSSQAGAEFSDPVSTMTVDQIMNNSSFQSGTLLSLSFRFYVSSDSWAEAFQSGYMELGYRYNSNNVIVPSKPFDGSNYYNDYNKGGSVSIRNSLYFLNYGVQFTTPGKIKTTHDFYIGFGLKFASYDMFETKDIEIPGTYSNYYSIKEKTGTRESVTLPCFTLGYIFGFGF